MDFLSENLLALRRRRELAQSLHAQWEKEREERKTSSRSREKSPKLRKTYAVNISDKPICKRDYDLRKLGCYIIRSDDCKPYYQGLEKVNRIKYPVTFIESQLFAPIRKRNRREKQRRNRRFKRILSHM